MYLRAPSGSYHSGNALTPKTLAHASRGCELQQLHYVFAHVRWFVQNALRAPAGKSYLQYGKNGSEDAVGSS